MSLHGNFLDYFIVFWAGILVSFTPCVYPLLPVTASIIGGLNTRGTRWFGLFLSLIYVLGLAVVYCALAAVAAIQGKAFGLHLNNPLAYILVSAVLFVFALILLDRIPMPLWGADLQNKIRPRGFGTLFLLGAVSGLVVGPCSGPILGTLLLYVASKQNLMHAITLLFVFSYGVGASLILAGTFSGFLARLPKSGPWLLRIKQIYAAILILVSAGFLLRALGLF